ncbi:MAG: iron ABC transporter permease, partial [Thermodesulfobacteriota bacterium]|nr:iron ABC transporter permease [Thermodesulfobacteriota bacterium]
MYWFALIPLAFLGLFYFYPLKEIFCLGLSSQDGHGDSLMDMVVRFGPTLWFTTWQAAVSTLLTIVLALPGAYVFARYDFYGKAVIKAFTTIPFVLPTVVVAAAFGALLGPQGLMNTAVMKVFGLSSPVIHMEQTIWIILLAHVFYNYTVVLRIVSTFWSSFDPSLVHAARMLGASRFQAFFRVTLPLLTPAILASGLLVFIFCFSSFGVILILGGPRYATIEVEIYRQALHIFDLRAASVLSILQISFTFCLMWLYTWLQRRYAVRLNPESKKITLKTCTTKRQCMIVGATVTFILIFLVLPLFSLVLKSFMTADGLSFMFYRELFRNTSQSIFFIPPVQAIGYSLGIACITLVIAVGIALLAANFLSSSQARFVSLLDPLFMLPLSTSAVTLGLGFILAFDEPPLNLRSSIVLLPLAHTLVAFPFVLRSVMPAFRSIPESMREAASMLGAGPFYVWRRIDLALVSKALVTGAVFAFTVSMGEFGATVFVAMPQTPT